MSRVLRSAVKLDENKLDVLRKPPRRTERSNRDLKNDVITKRFSSRPAKNNACAVSKNTTDKSPIIPQIVGRHSEINDLSKYIRSFLDTEQNGSIYASGSPGTGKTATIEHVVDQFVISDRCIKIMINCMQINSNNTIYSQLACAIKNGISNVNCDAKVVEDLFNRSAHKGTYILILDEIDQLSSRSQDILYRIFDWPTTLVCGIIIIGIANALDLPERLLPKMKAKAYQPIHIIFRPYTQCEIEEIVNAKLSQCQGIETAIEPIAVMLCAKKIAASTGDVRKAIDICNRAVELALKDARGDQSLIDQTVKITNTKAVPTIKHVSQALRESQFSQLMVNSAVNDDSPIHHKVVLASCMLLRKQKNLRELSFNELYETYLIVCERKQLNKLDQSELVSVCELLDSRGLIQFTGPRCSMEPKSFGTPARLRRIKLRVDDLGLEQMIKHDLLLSNVMYIKL